MLSACLAGAAVGCGPANPPPPVPATPAPPEPAAPTTLTPAQIAERATPSVVTVRTPRGLGTGFFVREGWIATNLHVIAGAPAVRVVLPDESEHDVEDVIAFDVDRDLVVLRVDADAMPTLPLAKPGAVRPGDPVVAIGHPLGLSDTVSNGLVSAVREVHPGLTLLQISAPIAPGSSGGPLLNERAEVIGIAAAVSRRGQNLNFGIPVPYLEALLAKPEPIPYAELSERLGELIADKAPPLPKIPRQIPEHELSLLDGCTDDDLRIVGHAIADAIRVGAPLYNRGDFGACYHIYEGASLDADRRLGTSCQGPRTALKAGRERAAGLTDAAAQAWAMRDAFDGLMGVIERKLRQP